ncbi:MAG: acetate kinase [Xylanivirga thermophila]|uniref:acetate kinase n=1 Tax=Xylanivirga thermophila TaxID=2496273 RepID=UPI00101B9F52|nr:acetate kinase [Xylanivirga thermophila]
MKILVINAGSSSLKYQLIDMTDESVLAKGNAERIGIEDSILKHLPTGREKVEIPAPMKTHTEAMKLVIKTLINPEYGVIKDMDEIAAVGHRVLHGGAKIFQSVVVDDDVKKVIKENFDLGPLHNPANLMGIEACQDVMPNTPMVAVFDTAFHQTMPEEAYMYALPYEAYEKYSIRRYGFHGTSHRYISKRIAKLLGKSPESIKIITCHLGNGSSVAAINGGKCVDTSMGLTPLEGLPMGTRCGSIDPAIIPFLMEKEDMTPEEMNVYMNKKSGVLGISGLSSDFRDLEKAAIKGDKKATLALDMFCYSVKKYIGAYAAAMDGVDYIIFTAGIGENTPSVREKVCANLDYMGVKIDKKKNNQIPGKLGKEGCISANDSKVGIYVVPTNEELMIARDTVEILGL